jgi:hypothetical protein
MSAAEHSRARAVTKGQRGDVARFQVPSPWMISMLDRDRQDEHLNVDHRRSRTRRASDPLGRNRWENCTMKKKMCKGTMKLQQEAFPYQR